MARRESVRANPNMAGFTATPEWLAFRLAILNRDGWRCVSCGRDVRGRGRARVDHIQPRRTHPHLAFVTENCRTLCVNCDNARHAEKGHRDQQAGALRGCNFDGTPRDPGHAWYGGEALYSAESEYSKALRGKQRR